MPISLTTLYTRLQSLLPTHPVTPHPSTLQSSSSTLPASLPTHGLGDEATAEHLLTDIVPGLNGSKTTGHYYGFVIGGVLPIAEVADNIVTALDQNVMVHLPEQSISTVVEDRASGMLVELLGLGEGWEGRVFTTGATGANVLGLGCGREAVLTSRLKKLGKKKGVAEMGLLKACYKAGVKEIQVLTSMGHSSLYKAAAVVGIGRCSVKDIGLSDAEPWRIDIERLERELEREKEGVVSIVVLSVGEVNSGRFATEGRHDMERIRELCDRYGAWLHVDGGTFLKLRYTILRMGLTYGITAFGLFARTLPQTPEFAALHRACEGIELADSITGDCHKMLNVPYDCGFFLTRSLPTLNSVFQNPNAAYLSTTPHSIPSPLNHGLENSRRFRALPVYAVLLSYGRDGLAEIFAQQVRLARGIAGFLEGCEGYELLAEGEGGRVEIEKIHVVVIFKARDRVVNEELVGRINRTGKVYVSGTKWGGEAACRFAVGTWMVDGEGDLEVIRGVLEGVLRD
ncbi:pyridoxal-dependent decarboxylase protein [Rutstroemia sp. NJR-2017a WRK4]|nr:pyridoxal-dependent decarboxylase protein [Rutstroemia sp. NJR-2017a WRK4]